MPVSPGVIAHYGQPLSEPSPEHTWERPFNRFGRGTVRSAMYTIHMLDDGQMKWHGPDTCWLGTRPLPLLREVGREARMLVREGMADILEWLGQDVITEPTSEQILESLKTPEKLHFHVALKRATA